MDASTPAASVDPGLPTPATANPEMPAHLAPEPAAKSAGTIAVPGIPQSAGESSGLMDFFVPGAIPYALAMILGAILLVRLLKGLFNRVSERVVKHRLVIKQVSTLIAFGLYTLAFVLALTSLFRLSSEAMLALSGTIAVTVGFALKDVAASFLAGITILTNKPFQVGDRISFGGYYGEVKEIGLRTVRLVTLDDNLVTIPTNKFLTDSVASANAGELDCMVVMTFHVDAKADHLRARAIVQEAVLASKYLYLGKPMVVLISTRLQDHGPVVVELTAKAYVYDARQEKAFASDVTDRVLQAFREEGVGIPGAGTVSETSADVPDGLVVTP